MYKPLDSNPMVQFKKLRLGPKNTFRFQIKTVNKSGNISFYVRCGHFHTAVPHTHVFFSPLVITFSVTGPVYIFYVHGVISIGTAGGCTVSIREQTRDTGLFGTGRMSCVACGKKYNLGLGIGNRTIYMMI